MDKKKFFEPEVKFVELDAVQMQAASPGPGKDTDTDLNEDDF